MFLANVLLARVRSKEEYGMFALSYSIYTFLSGLHNAAILEPFTVYGSGRYHRDFPSYARLMWRSNAVLGLAVTVVLLLIWQGLHWTEHWKYARWVLATALVFQFMTQGYYWLLAGFLSVKEVAEFRAMHILVSPVDQAFGAMTLVILPMMAFRYASKKFTSLASLW